MTIRQMRDNMRQLSKMSTRSRNINRAGIYVSNIMSNFDFETMKEEYHIEAVFIMQKALHKYRTIRGR